MVEIHKCILDLGLLRIAAGNRLNGDLTQFRQRTFDINIPIDRFEHCNFTPEEALLSFGLMLLYAGDLDTLSGIGVVLRGDELQAFENMAKQYGLPYRIEGEQLKAIGK